MSDNSTGKIKRTRNKPVKSCSFCRHRKLKCDKKRPICSSCKSRNLATCVYTDTRRKPTISDVVPTELGLEQTRLISKVNTLERQVEEITRRSPSSNSSTTPTPMYKNNPLFIATVDQSASMSTATSPSYIDPNIFQNYDTDVPNPLNDYYVLQCKPSGRRILYGATSMRASLSRHKFGFGEKYDQLWGKVKFERNKWKQKHNMSSLQELKYVERPNDNMFNTILDRLCFELPPYNKCIEIINLFFNPIFQDLHIVNSVLDKNKVINDFYTCFIPDSENILPNGDRKIKTLLAGNKKNYYKVAVIVQIITLRYYYQNCPESVNILNLYLLGEFSAKVFFIERLQFLLLRCYYIRNYKTDCDDSNIINMVSNLLSTAITMGLDRNIDQVYKEQENIVGNLRSLKNMWLIIQFLDLESALQTGRSLQLANSEIDFQSDNQIFDGDTKLNKLMKITKLGRRVLMCLTARRGTPQFQGLSDCVMEFMENELPNIGFFTDAERLKQIDINDIRIVTFCLDMILCLNKLNFGVIKDIDPKLRNLSVHLCLLSFHVFDAATERCFQLDKEYFPEMFNENTSNLTPYFIQSIGLTGGLLPRITYIFCSIMYYRLTLFMSKDFLFLNQPKYHWDASSLRAPKEDIPIAAALDIHIKLCSRWLSPTDPIKIKIMSNSYHFVIANAIQKTFRKVLDKCAEYRKNAEEAWVAHLGDDLYAVDQPPNSMRNLLTPEVSNSDIISRKSCPISLLTNSKNMNSVAVQLDSEELEPGMSQPYGVENNYTDDDKTSSSSSDTLNTNAAYVTTAIPKNIDTGEKVTTEEKEAEMLQQITDEFWSSYNTGWKEVVNNTNAHDFFSNCS